MSAMKPIFRELLDAILDGFAHAKDKLHHLADNVHDHLDDVITQIKGIDKFDGPGAQLLPASIPIVRTPAASLRR